MTEQGKETLDMSRLTGDDRVTFTVEEAAQLLGISRSTAYECIRTGELPSVKFGRRVLVPRHRFQRLLDGEAA